MELSKPIYKISKEIGVETNRILIACKTLGISAKASTKRLNSEEIENIINYFNSGRNASSETIDIGNKKSEKVNKVNSIKKDNQYLETIYFPNRLIG
tara:strand:+ start:553 stop:843 length:291 start_codon:yes stop_codon:yes gene_type:complete